MKNVVITGTSRGIGYELALRYADEGHRVIAISRQIPDVLARHENITCVAADLAVEDEVHRISRIFEATLQRIDILIHNAGSLVLKPFSQTTIEDFQQVYGVNVFAVASLTRAALPYLQGNSHVVTVSSMGGIQGSVKFAGLSAYSSSKGAVITLTEMLAEEFRDQKISFNCLAIGAVQTEMLQEAFPGYEAPLSASEMAEFIFDFGLNGHKFFNGKIIQVSTSTP